MTFDLRRLDARDVLRLYCQERDRREHPPSIAGTDPDMPRAPSPAIPSGYWEQLCRLVVGVPNASLACWRLHFGGWGGHVPRPCAQPYASESTDEEQAVAVLLCAVPPNRRQIAAAMGLAAAEVKALMGEATRAVAENLGRARGGQ